MSKVDEELREVKAELNLPDNKEHLTEEIGDLLFSVAQLARHEDIDPEEALKQANIKFIKRIHKVEDKLKSEKRNIKKMSTEELEKVWQEIKLTD